MEAIETVELANGLTAYINHDQDCESPREWSNLGKLCLTEHRQYMLPFEADKGFQSSDLLEMLASIHYDTDCEDTVWEKIKRYGTDGGAVTYDDTTIGYLAKLSKGNIVLSVYMYEHSGIAIQTTPTVPRGILAGIIYCSKAEARLEYKDYKPRQAYEKAKVAMKYEVEAYEAYLNGKVYRCVVEDTDEDEVESCSGFIGMDAVMEYLHSEYGLPNTL